MENEEKITSTEETEDIHPIEEIAEVLKILFKRNCLSGGAVDGAIREARENARKAEEMSDKH